MGNVNAIPVVSQVKSAVQAIGGDSEGARKTQDDFSKQCPVVSQVRSTVQAIGGDLEGARKTQEEFSKELVGQLISATRDRKEVSLTCDVAPSYGTLTSKAFRSMDKELIIMIAGTTKKFAGLRDKSWENVVSMMTQDVLIEPMGDEIVRTDTFRKSGTNFFKIDGNPDAPVVHEVRHWFNCLIQDEDVLKSCGVDIGVMADIVAATGASIGSLEAIAFKKEYHEKEVLKIGVLRYPDFEHPYFRLFRINLIAWSDCTRVLFAQTDSNGIKGDFRVRKYKPRSSVINEMTSEVQDRAVDEANDMFP